MTVLEAGLSCPPIGAIPDEAIVVTPETVEIGAGRSLLWIRRPQWLPWFILALLMVLGWIGNGSLVLSFVGTIHPSRLGQVFFNPRLPSLMALFKGVSLRSPALRLYMLAGVIRLAAGGGCWFWIGRWGDSGSQYRMLSRLASTAKVLAADLLSFIWELFPRKVRYRCERINWWLGEYLARVWYWAMHRDGKISSWYKRLARSTTARLRNSAWGWCRRHPRSAVLTVSFLHWVPYFPSGPFFYAIGRTRTESKSLVSSKDRSVKPSQFMAAQGLGLLSYLFVVWACQPAWLLAIYP